jgi:hypothetical protein
MDGWSPTQADTGRADQVVVPGGNRGPVSLTRQAGGNGENTPLPLILARACLPASLRDQPAAALRYLVSRDCFVARLYQKRTGYWQPDGQGLDARCLEERAAAFDLLTGGKAEGFVNAAAALVEKRDLTLALEILAPGLLRHPDSGEPADLRQAVLIRLMDERQMSDPFGFLFTQNSLAQSSPRSGSRGPLACC